MGYKSFVSKQDLSDVHKYLNKDTFSSELDAIDNGAFIYEKLRSMHYTEEEIKFISNKFYLMSLTE